MLSVATLEYLLCLNTRKLVLPVATGRIPFDPVVTWVSGGEVFAFFGVLIVVT
jgi:hypothetical protein